MKNPCLKSRIITELAYEIRTGTSNALNIFWDEIKDKGTPMIEEIEGDLDNVLVTFIYKAEKKINNIVIIPSFGWQNYVENRMERLLDTNLWYKTYKLRKDIRFSYSFSLSDTLDDDWQKRSDRSVYDKLNKNKLVFKSDNGKGIDIESYAIMPEAEEQLWSEENHHITKGVLHEHRFYSEILNNDRRIWVYTPNGYDKGNDSYAFLLLTDGEEYINVLSAPEVLNNLIYYNKIPAIITIFVETTINRNKELMCNDSFAKCLVEEIIPWVRENYNISSKTSDGIIGGLSLGGLTASYVGLKYPQVFGNVLSQSGSYWYKPEDYDEDHWLSRQFEMIDKLPLKFYMNVGILETKDRMIDTNKKLRDVLKGKGYNVHFEEFKSGHDYLCWGETLGNGLIWLIGLD